MKSQRSVLFILIALYLFAGSALAQDSHTVRVGVPTVLSGDLAVLGQNIRRTIETYQKHLLRHRIEFEFEDAGISSQAGLRAYQLLINIKKVDLLIGGTSSNGTMAGSALINSSRTVMLTPITGGSNIDHAGEYVFRIGNSDILNGVDQSNYFTSKAVTRVAVLTEQTEYTEDISHHFQHKFEESGGTLVFNESFAPATTDFRSQITKILAASPQAIFIPTQTGTALALFLKQLHQLGGFKGEVHTTFVAAPNPDARKIAGKLIRGVRYMNPAYDKKSQAMADFLALYKKDHGADPDIAFHSAGTVDALNILQDYLDHSSGYDRNGFKDYLLTKVKNYKGLMGTYSFDVDGNTNLGFEPAVIE